MLNKLNWQAFTSLERNKTIEELKEIISRNDGFIVHFNFFSDLALSLTIEIEEKNIPRLYTEIENSMKILESEPENMNANSKKEWWILLNVSFSTGKGNLKVEIPNVPR